MDHKIGFGWEIGWKCDKMHVACTLIWCSDQYFLFTAEAPGIVTADCSRRTDLRRRHLKTPSWHHPTCTTPACSCWRLVVATQGVPVLTSVALCSATMNCVQVWMFKTLSTHVVRLLWYLRFILCFIQVFYHICVIYSCILDWISE